MKIKSTDNEQIYIRKINVKEDGSKTRRQQNSVQSCLFCGKLVIHLLPHLKNKHSTEEEVKTLGDQALTSNKHPKKKKDLDRVPLHDLLRYKGNHKHNMKVLKEGGELLFARRPQGEFNHTVYGPCPKCKDWLLKTSISLNININAQESRELKMENSHKKGHLKLRASLLWVRCLMFPN